MRHSAVLTVGMLCFFFSPSAEPQRQAPDGLPRYRVIRVVDADSFQGQINEAAGKGYRLVAATRAEGQSLAAILERNESSSERYSYLLVPILGAKSKHSSAGKTKAQVAGQLNAAAAKGFHLAATLNAGRAEMGFAVMESDTTSREVYEYALVTPNGFGHYRNGEILRLVASGYRWVAAGSNVLGGSLLFFEKAPDVNGRSGASAGQPVAASLKGPDFPQSSLVAPPPERQLHKAAAGGAQVSDFFAYPPHAILAMKGSSAVQAPYEYVVLKPKKGASPAVSGAAGSMVEASDLTGLGQQGFCLLRLSTAAPPFVMEKRPGEAKHYEYQFASGRELSELAEKLNRPELGAFRVAKMQSVEDRLLVIMEKMDGAEP